MLGQLQPDQYPGGPERHDLVVVRWEQLLLPLQRGWRGHRVRRLDHRRLSHRYVLHADGQWPGWHLDLQCQPQCVSNAHLLGVVQRLSRELLLALVVKRGQLHLQLRGRWQRPDRVLGYPGDRPDPAAVHSDRDGWLRHCDELLSALKPTDVGYPARHRTEAPNGSNHRSMSTASRRGSWTTTRLLGRSHAPGRGPFQPARAAPRARETGSSRLARTGASSPYRARAHPT
jgi:hypothetical protein